MSLVIIMRGLPGSGKSYCVEKIKKHTKNVVVCSADHFFIDGNGKYNFNANQLGLAHGACKNKFIKALEEDSSSIVVDNTNTTWSEFKEYIEYAAIAGADIIIMEMADNVEECFKRNTHGVPLEVIQRMKERFASKEDIIKLAKEMFNVEIKYEKSIFNK